MLRQISLTVYSLTSQFHSTLVEGNIQLTGNSVSLAVIVHKQLHLQQKRTGKKTQVIDKDTNCRAEELCSILAINIVEREHA